MTACLVPSEADHLAKCFDEEAAFLLPMIRKRKVIQFTTRIAVIELERTFCCYREHGCGHYPFKSRGEAERKSIASSAASIIANVAGVINPCG